MRCLSIIIVAVAVLYHCMSVTQRELYRMFWASVKLKKKKREIKQKNRSQRTIPSHVTCNLRSLVLHVHTYNNTSCET